MACSNYRTYSFFKSKLSNTKEENHFRYPRAESYQNYEKPICEADSGGKRSHSPSQWHMPPESEEPLSKKKRQELTKLTPLTPTVTAAAFSATRTFRPALENFTAYEDSFYTSPNYPAYGGHIPYQTWSQVPYNLTGFSDNCHPN